MIHQMCEQCYFVLIERDFLCSRMVKCEKKCIFELTGWSHKKWNLYPINFCFKKNGTHCSWNHNNCSIYWGLGNYCYFQWVTRTLCLFPVYFLYNHKQLNRYLLARFSSLLVIRLMAPGFWWLLAIGWCQFLADDSFLHGNLIMKMYRQRTEYRETLIKM